MKLYVMRHGPAEEASASGRDEDRALTSAGRDRVRNVAKALVEASEEPLRILTSPLVRAVQTAEIVALVTKLTERGGVVEARREVSPRGDLAGLVDSLLDAGAKRVMIAGHEPDLSELLEGTLGRFGRTFEKAMVVGLHLAPGNGEAQLRFVLDPKTLAFDVPS